MQLISDKNIEAWQQVDAQVFWGEIAPQDHVVQIYDNDEKFFDLLAGYVAGGFRAGDSVVIIATDPHLCELNARLRKMGFDPFYLALRQQYVPLDAHETLAQFMVNGWPDAALFDATISEVLVKAGRNGRLIRAFGEMVAILWAQGLTGATVQLEHLWNKFAESQKFCLFCAYPKSGFTGNAVESIQHICSTHSKIVTGPVGNSNDIRFAPVQKAG